MLIIIGLVISIVAGFYLLSQRRPKLYPPGPWGLPILGHLHLLGEKPQQTLMDWRKQYGPIFACDLGSFRGVVLTDYKHIKEALNDPAFSGRPKLRAFSDRCGVNGGNTRGVIFTEGQEWIDQRRFALRNLRDFGFGKRTQEGLIQEEVVELIDKLKQDVNHPISTRIRFNTAVINALWTMIAGVRHSHDDPKLKEVVKLMTDSMADPSLAALFMPWLTYLAPDWSGWNIFMSDILPTLKFLQKYIDDHKKTIIADNPRDFIDVYLDEIAKTTDSTSSFFKDSGEISLKVTLMDFFFASNETTSHTMSWTILYLALNSNKHIQTRAQEEIDRVVGHSRMPTLADRPNLIYIEATIMETMRYSSVIPLGVWHSTVQDVEFHGYHIPKDTMILPNLYCIHFDPNLWDNPQEFRPERFISNDGKSIVKPEAFMPFATGRRICIGESLAKDELFLMTSAILQSFSFETTAEDPNPSLEPIPGPISAPKPHEIIFHLRSVCE